MHTSDAIAGEAVASWRSTGSLPLLAAGASVEMPASAHARMAPQLGRLPLGTSIYLPYTPSSAISDTIQACDALAGVGLRPVPHLAARAVPSRRWLEESLHRLAAAGADSLLLIGGDRGSPEGPFSDTLQILDTGLLTRFGFTRIGVAGHPEGHPVAPADAVQRALEAKAAYARETGADMWLVSQFVFDAEPVLDWMRRIREADIHLPVWVGVPGGARLRTLWQYARQCGVGASARMLVKRPELALAMTGKWRPDQLVEELARHYAAGTAGAMAGIHLFPFGGLRAGVEWLGALRQGLPPSR